MTQTCIEEMLAAERTHHRAVYKAGVPVPLDRRAAPPARQAAE